MTTNIFQDSWRVVISEVVKTEIRHLISCSASADAWADFRGRYLATADSISEPYKRKAAVASTTTTFTAAPAAISTATAAAAMTTAGGAPVGGTLSVLLDSGKFTSATVENKAEAIISGCPVEMPKQPYNFVEAASLKVKAGLAEIMAEGGKAHLAIQADARCLLYGHQRMDAGIYLGVPLGASRYAIEPVQFGDDHLEGTTVAQYLEKNMGIGAT